MWKQAGRQLLLLRHQTSASWLQRLRAMSTFQVVNPATEEVLAEVPEDSASDVNEKFRKAASGQKAWQARPLSSRKEILARFNQLLLRDIDLLATTLTKEMGKPISQARNEIKGTSLRVKFLMDNVDKVMQDEVMLSTEKLIEVVTHEPLGVVANISAWNYPYFVSSNVFAAALLTGNSVLYKPSELATLTGQHITRLLHEAGVPEDAFVPVYGGGATGKAVASTRGLGGVFFTGSNKTGAAIAKEAAKNMTKVQLELGGKDPVYVRADVADVARVAEALADGAFYNGGQSCCAVERIYVHADIYNRFVNEFGKAVRDFKMGNPLNTGTYLGPLARQPQLAFLKSQVKDALAKGAVALLGGDCSSPFEEGYFFPPVVLINVNHSMDVMRHESFGPLIGIQKVNSDEEALELMLDTEYGLTAGVYTSSREDAKRILSRLDVGTGYWNCCDRVSPRLPWSGRKGSGVGSTLGLEGLRAFLRPKALHLQSP